MAHKQLTLSLSPGHCEAGDATGMGSVSVARFSLAGSERCSGHSSFPFARD